VQGVDDKEEDTATTALAVTSNGLILSFENKRNATSKDQSKLKEIIDLNTQSFSSSFVIKKSFANKQNYEIASPHPHPNVCNADSSWLATWIKNKNKNCEDAGLTSLILTLQHRSNITRAVLILLLCQASIPVYGDEPPYRFKLDEKSCMHPEKDKHRDISLLQPKKKYARDTADSGPLGTTLSEINRLINLL
ncbi:hypothetical protein ACJX0J_027659, partial [Zea mays]